MIAEGIVSRVKAGAYGKDDEGEAQFAKVVDDIAVAASSAVDRLG